jgi:hypothetical protein
LFLFSFSFSFNNVNGARSRSATARNIIEEGSTPAAAAAPGSGTMTRRCVQGTFKGVAHVWNC